ncbi:endolytic transglycosylase MltG [Dinghuibacter silviterrae]|uniref:Endolytic murein transglycosylase n=1 Tax=Dinghuibacter silviterrae TaxID=1539049 RepID=A0A4R8DJK6_9BACT|nr:endolytic transglycosylase MltG [Dinghuibacter silviterrae]TDW97366.1 UPF0755 protein [Dinghuibacter silviterrae]
MRKILTLLFIALLLLCAAAAWVVIGPGTCFAPPKKSLYVHTGKTDKASVMQTLHSAAYIKYPRIFDWLATKMGVWNKVKPGRYEIPHGYSLLHLLQDLKNGNTTPIKLVLTKVHTKEELAGALGTLFEPDSADVLNYLENTDSVKAFDRDTDNVLTLVIPDTYEADWNSTIPQLLQLFRDNEIKFWTAQRRAEAQNLGITPTQAYILASIVEEETRKDSDKPLIASVYLNRLAKGMRLSADPTVKFAMHDFSIKRIYDKYTRIESPYNTYMNPGLPPGPICTPSVKTLDATLAAPKTDYLFFVAKPDFSGYSTFASDYATHIKNAKAYQEALDSLMKSK